MWPLATWQARIAALMMMHTSGPKTPIVLKVHLIGNLLPPRMISVDHDVEEAKYYPQRRPSLSEGALTFLGDTYGLLVDRRIASEDYVFEGGNLAVVEFGRRRV